MDDSNQLEATCDKLNALFQEVETKFIELKLITPAFIALTPTIGLGFGKDKGEWKLLVLRGEVCNRLLNDSREVRIFASSKIVALCDALIAKNVEASSEINKAVLNVEGAINTINTITMSKSKRQK